MRSTAPRALLVAGLTLACLTPPLSAGKAGQVRTESFRLLNEGVAAYNRGEYALAVEHLQRSSGIALNSFRAHYYLGLALNASRRYAEALTALDIALELDGTHLPALIALGDARLKLGELDEARAAYYQAVKLRPGFSAALDGLARSYESQSRIDEAVEHYRQAILSNRGFAPAYANLGSLYLRENRLDEALRLLEEAVTIRPDYAPGLNRLAEVYARMNLKNRAVATVRRAIELEPEEPHHLETLGRLQLSEGYVGDAERSFKSALALEPTLVEARMGQAEVARRRGEYAQAQAELDQAQATGRFSGSLAARLAALRLRLDAEARHTTELEARVAGGSASPEDRIALADLLAGRGEWERAATLRLAGSADPGGDEILAYLFFRAGRYREAQGIYRNLAGGADPGRHRINEGVALARLGNDAGAAEAFRAALARDPTQAPARLYLANAMLRSGHSAQAAEAYGRFLQDDPRGESSEQVRRILRQIAPGSVPDEVPTELPLPPPPAPLEPQDP